MSHERTVGGFVKDIEHLSGVKIKLVRLWSGWYLEDCETGNQYHLGILRKWDVLSPSDQESICRGLFREHWIVLLGLGGPDD